MQPHNHFNPNQVNTYTAELSTICTIAYLAAALYLSVEQFDISAAIFRGNYDPDTVVKVCQLPRSGGTYKHSCTAGKLIEKLHGTLPASYIDFKALEKLLTSAGYTQASSDPCLFLRHTIDDPILLTITMHDFFVAAASPQLKEQLSHTLSSRCNIRRLGQPQLVLTWRIEIFSSGAIHKSQPHTIPSILTK